MSGRHILKMVSKLPATLVRCTVLAVFALLFACESTSDSVPSIKSNDQSTDREIVTSESVAGKMMLAGIRPLENQLAANQSVEVLFYLSNNTDEAVEVLPWATPLERPLSADLFSVTLNGEALPYAGRVVKRQAPTAADYLTLQPGEKRESVVNLSQAYDMRSIGDYQIKLERLSLQNSTGAVSAVVDDSVVMVVRQ